MFTAGHWKYIQTHSLFLIAKQCFSVNLPYCRKLVEREPSERCIFISFLFHIWLLINIYLDIPCQKL